MVYVCLCVPVCVCVVSLRVSVCMCLCVVCNDNFVSFIWDKVGETWKGLEGVEGEMKINVNTAFK